MEDKCRNCGRCCHFLIKGVKTKCPFLQFLPNGTTKCRKYYSRLGTTIGPGVKCGMRDSVKFNYKDCPYNREGQVELW